MVVYLHSMNTVVLCPPSSPPADINSLNMTLISNDPSWWSTLNFYQVYNYYIVASLTVVGYDWALTLGREFELIWQQRWSHMTVLYISVRYVGVPFTVMLVLSTMSVSLTDTVSTITHFMMNWMSFVINAIMGVIMITRLHAMYRRSRKMLVFLSVLFLTIQIVSGVIIAIIQTRLVSVEEYVLSGTHVCNYYFEGDAIFLIELTWILGTAWEILVLCLAVWIAIKHFCELQRASTGWAVRDCFMVLIQTHLFYFASFLAASCLRLIDFSPEITDYSLQRSELFYGVLAISEVVQMFLLGPRLILSIRDCHARLVANSQEGTAVTTMAFQGTHVSTGGDGV
ncbi:hypothetical protein K503DRAFT_381025 [Rhizopogon vinicolor AM-OR11-026]|uniref:DUF6533 domain-containing protein n=1 Tax=Rhizopogon vinicolor AM-OR11-026 TaxID=1314800 RepID=A0A1B7MRI5_9AGAM|nr:hypothetical protein K503DRAFT_381025 [Rhizopogon vinicolor AM-OR11-026]